MHPEGVRYGITNFSDAFEWAKNYPYCSLSDNIGATQRPMVNSTLLREMFTPDKYKTLARDFMLSKSWSGETVPNQGSFLDYTKPNPAEVRPPQK